MKTNPINLKFSNLFFSIIIIYWIIALGITIIDAFKNDVKIKSNIDEEQFETGVYVSYYPNFTIELNENGNVFITPKKNNTFYCTRKGNWTINDSNITIQITDKNEDVYCDWVENLEGIWKINGNTISKDNYTLIKN